ncbi:S9 family peptidase [Chryseobacterium indologenes]|uniref:alpha/beta hydrolase family protein n=1 Tax=Chryseobacterium indologenes TaxID=253 RepID=UPI0003E0845F|nr:prolyl oligopeptidase family serine peptidase [Chryseobacterium indologenes]ATN05025.1 S9 family peptidase [Chryseobacterium indologenes]AYY86223.1 S9 family peptidase [Chryseobacterium indologenes]QIX83124.1 S9 family peptidase [Chryseobacterium indologenes]QPQ51137.1 S9 family peptidase [Chryseobacterium indologenes]UDQ52803.1 prolyl oligopeptidase family serine peptidase [Chryseobacterium indologenes]
MKIKLTICLLAFLNFYDAQENITYQKPSSEILKLADYQRPPSVMMNNKKDWVVFTYRPTYKTLQDLSQQEMKLGGLRINPVTNIASTATYFNDLKIRKINDKNEIQVKNMPADAKITYISFSPDEKKLAFTNTTTKGVELWVIDLENASAKKISEDNLNANLGVPYLWANDSQSLLIKKLPQNRPALIDASKDLPTGPIVSTADGKVSQNRTYQDLLKNPQDEKNFEVLTASEINSVDFNGNQKKLKDQDMYANLSFSPDGNYLLATVFKKPFSYIVPLDRFPMTTTVYDKNGNTVKVVNEVPLNEIMPKGFSSVRTGKRDMTWRNDAPATLVFAEARDGGDQHKKAEYRDEIFTWEAPFTAAPKSFFKTKQRYEDVEWTNDHYAIISESWYDTRNTKSFLVDLNNGESKVIDDRNSQDVYSDPGHFNTVKNHYGRTVIDMKGGKAYLIGAGFTKDGQHPFIDEMDVKSLKKKRWYTSNLKNAKEAIVDILNPSKGEILTTQQSPSEYPNYFKKSIKSNKVQAVTHFVNPFESMKDVYKEVITYKRNDGVTLTGTLYLPAHYDRKAKTEKLPLLIWAYPREYKDANTAGQSTQNPNDFTFPYYGSFVYWVTKGYAVLDNAAFPIIGEGKTEPNDTFLTQLVANADAAIKAVDQLGYIDKKKVAVGGHSYGAFMTANLLTHSDLFACGIARSGAYNRTLTPFGFQSEQRNYWDVPEIYNTMSPFMHADKMKTPLLLIHGDADNNPGTFTLQTERYFQALKNLGAPVKMVLLPKESHSYQAKENIMHVLWEQDQFLEKCLKK